VLRSSIDALQPSTLAPQAPARGLLAVERNAWNLPPTRGLRWRPDHPGSLQPIELHPERRVEHCHEPSAAKSTGDEADTPLREWVERALGAVQPRTIAISHEIALEVYTLPEPELIDQIFDVLNYPRRRSAGVRRRLVRCSG
jgi:hypothetical protein